MSFDPLKDLLGLTDSTGVKQERAGCAEVCRKIAEKEDERRIRTGDPVEARVRRETARLLRLAATAIEARGRA